MPERGQEGHRAADFPDGAEQKPEAVLGSDRKRQRVRAPADDGDGERGEQAAQEDRLVKRQGRRDGLHAGVVDGERPHRDAHPERTAGIGGQGHGPVPYRRAGLRAPRRLPLLACGGKGSGRAELSPAQIRRPAPAGAGRLVRSVPRSGQSRLS